MKVSILDHSLPLLEADLLILTLFESESGQALFGQVDAILGGKLGQLSALGEITGKKNEVTQLHSLWDWKVKHVLILGMGKKSTLPMAENFRRTAGHAARIAQKLKAKSVVWGVEPTQLSEKEVAQAVCEGYIMGGYQFQVYKKNEDREPTQTFQFIGLSKNDETELGLQEGQILGQSVCMARDLANLPANVLTPHRFVEKAKALFSDHPEVKIDVLDCKKAEKLGMGAFVGVAQGSAEEPFMMAISYTPVPGKPVLGMVGKGVTFDTGGISIKPANGMEEMIGDMSGAAAVLAALYALVRMKAETSILVVLPLVENMVSGTAQRPGDIVIAMNGKSIEVTNTDAEGRLILADALCYAVSKGCSCLVDVATLTGACSIALGDQAAAILGNDQDLINRFLEVGLRTGETLWQLPLYEAYFEYMESSVADMINSSDKRLAGTATGAIFLKQFVNETPWVHLDIASMMSVKKSSGYTPKGMSGFGVRNLVAFARGYS